MPAGQLQRLSVRNPRVKRLARLVRQGELRDAASVLVADGPVLVCAAVAAGLDVQELFVDPSAGRRPDVADAVARATDSGALAFLLDGPLRGHAATVTPNGLAAVVHRPSLPRALDVSEREDALVLVLVGVGDPGNVGTLVRVGEAVGARRVVLAEQSADPWSPKAVRASAGSVFRVPVEVAGSAESSLADLGQRGYRRIGTRADAPVAYDDLDLEGPIALVLGAEAHGLPDSLDGLLDEVTSIPMAGRVESLNVAMAGAVLGFEVYGRHRANRSNRRGR